MLVRVQEQKVDARVIRDGDQLVLLVRPKLLSDRAYVAIGLALSALVEHGNQYLEHAG